jgi:hypothetical protein
MPVSMTHSLLVIDANEVIMMIMVDRDYLYQILLFLFQFRLF